LCVGEKIASVRQLIKRFNVQTPFTGVNDYWAVTPGASGQRLELQPNYFKGGTPEGATRMDYLSWFASIFAFYRGSVRFKIVPTGWIDEYPSLNVMLDPTTLYTNTDIVTLATDTTITRGRGAEVILPTIEGAWEIQCPFYCSYPVALTTANATAFDVLGARNGFNKTYARFPDSAGSTGTYNVMIYRASGDDFNFGFLLGPPVVNHA